MFTLCGAVLLSMGCSAVHTDLGHGRPNTDDAEFTIRQMCDEVPVTVAGRFLHADANGELVPLTDAQVLFGQLVWGEPMQPLEEIDVPITDRGEFEFVVLIPHSVRERTRKGKTSTSEVYVPRSLRILAPGCDTRELTVDENWTFQDVVLVCPGRVSRHSG